jgi:hypothetical protein
MQTIPWKQSVLSAAQKMRLLFFPPISRRKALSIAIEKGIPVSPSDPVHGRIPGKVCIYSAPTEPCWFIFAPWNDGKVMLIRSSRIILISKETGRIMYDGEAGDEG